MIGVHEFKITVQSVSGSTIMDVVYKLTDDSGEHFRDASWMGKVDPDKLVDAVCEVIKGTCKTKIKMSLPTCSRKECQFE